MRRAIRNRLSEICLAALAEASAAAPLHALLAFVRSADAGGVARGLGERDGAQLLGLGGLFETCGDGALRIRPDLLGDLGALEERTGRIARAVAACRSRCGGPPHPAHRATRTSGSTPAPSEDEIRWALCAASALFNAKLFFEVHEILESYWGRSQIPEMRRFLQGLIQVAVGLHHRDNENRRGALALLAAGRAKLAPFRPAAYGLDLEDFCRAIGKIASPGDERAYGAAAPRLLLQRRPARRPAQRSEITR
jgi:Domain of unknown function (DUF309)